MDGGVEIGGGGYFTGGMPVKGAAEVTRHDKLVALLEAARAGGLTSAACAELIMFWIYMQSDVRAPEAEAWCDELVQAEPKWGELALSQGAITFIYGNADLFIDVANSWNPSNVMSGSPITDSQDEPHCIEPDRFFPSRIRQEKKACPARGIPGEDGTSGSLEPTDGSD